MLLLVLLCASVAAAHEMRCGVPGCNDLAVQRCYYTLAEAAVFAGHDVPEVAVCLRHELRCPAALAHQKARAEKTRAEKEEYERQWAEWRDERPVWVYLFPLALVPMALFIVFATTRIVLWCFPTSADRAAADGKPFMFTTFFVFGSTALAALHVFCWITGAPLL